MCPDNKYTIEDILVVTSSKLVQGTYNSFVYELPQNTRFSKIELLSVSMTLPSISNVCIHINELGMGGTKLGGRSNNDCTFFIPSQATVVNWTPNTQYDQVVDTKMNISYNIFSVSVTDENSNPIALTSNWSMVFRVIKNNMI